MNVIKQDDLAPTMAITWPGWTTKLGVFMAGDVLVILVLLGII